MSNRFMRVEPVRIEHLPEGGEWKPFEFQRNGGWGDAASGGGGQFDLEFVPILTERYFLLCDETTLADPHFLPVMAVLQTSEFRTQVSKLPGHDAANTGTVMTVQEAFPQWRAA